MIFPACSNWSRSTVCRRFYRWTSYRVQRERKQRQAEEKLRFFREAHEESNAESFLDQFLQREEREEVITLLHLLRPKQQRVIRAVYGLDGRERTVCSKRLSAEMRMTTEGVRLVHAEALRKLRALYHQRTPGSLPGWRMRRT